MVETVLEKAATVQYWDGNAKWHKLWVEHNNYHDEIINLLPRTFIDLIKQTGLWPEKGGFIMCGTNGHKHSHTHGHSHKHPHVHAQEEKKESLDNAHTHEHEHEHEHLHEHDDKGTSGEHEHKHPGHEKEIHKHKEN